MALQFQIATGNNVPIYRQIADQIRRAISMGDLVPGDQLPTVRALAEQLIVNPNTVAKVYTMLAQEGVVEGYVGRGLFVAARRQLLSEEERERRLAVALDAFFNEVLFLDFSAEQIMELLSQKFKALESTPASSTPKDVK
ncbi:GntR family transcriptional regulator [bacterium]|nr:MAG: GntR family transcriptional regulator [bacterium]